MFVLIFLCNQYLVIHFYKNEVIIFLIFPCLNVFLTAILQIWEEFKIIIAEELQVDHEIFERNRGKVLKCLAKKD